MEIFELRIVTEGLTDGDSFVEEFDYESDCMERAKEVSDEGINGRKVTSIEIWKHTLLVKE